MVEKEEDRMLEAMLTLLDPAPSPCREELLLSGVCAFPSADTLILSVVPLALRLVVAESPNKNGAARKRERLGYSFGLRAGALSSPVRRCEFSCDLMLCEYVGTLCCRGEGEFALREAGEGEEKVVALGVVGVVGEGDL